MLGGELDVEDTEEKSYLCACGKRESYGRLYRFPNRTKRIAKDDCRSTLCVLITRAVLNSAEFRFEHLSPLAMLNLSQSVSVFFSKKLRRLFSR